jgi:SAM-dependent methyltransferase
MSDVAPYEVLAAGYDVVMSHVDYEEWATYIHTLFQRFSDTEIESVCELGCGTGSLALELQPLADYQMVGLDNAPNMIRFAQEKAEWMQVPAQFEVNDFTNFRLSTPVDAMILLQDGLNYLLELPQVDELLQCVKKSLKPKGLFVVDQSTPHNSINNEKYFDDEDGAEGFHYIRRSHYDKETFLHTTRFEIHYDGQVYKEQHVQRAYTKSEMQARFLENGFEILAAFEDMTFKAATDASERIHWILQHPS